MHIRLQLEHHHPFLPITPSSFHSILYFDFSSYEHHSIGKQQPDISLLCYLDHKRAKETSRADLAYLSLSGTFLETIDQGGAKWAHGSDISGAEKVPFHWVALDFPGPLALDERILGTGMGMEESLFLGLR